MKRRSLRLEWKVVGSEGDGKGVDEKVDMVGRPRQDMGDMGSREPDVVKEGVRVLDGGSTVVDRTQGWLWRRVWMMKILARGHC